MDVHYSWAYEIYVWKELNRLIAKTSFISKCPYPRPNYYPYQHSHHWTLIIISITYFTIYTITLAAPLLLRLPSFSPSSGFESGIKNVNVYVWGRLSSTPLLYPRPMSLPDPFQISRASPKNDSKWNSYTKFQLQAAAPAFSPPHPHFAHPPPPSPLQIIFRVHLSSRNRPSACTFFSLILILFPLPLRQQPFLFLSCLFDPSLR